MKKLVALLACLSLVILASCGKGDDVPKSVESDMDELLTRAKEQGHFEIEKDDISYDKNTKTLNIHFGWKYNIDYPAQKIGNNLGASFNDNKLVQNIRFKYEVNGKKKDYTVKKDNDNQFKLEK
ncbi:hypothetical protein [Staphylococcus edaphicus]|uniref:DUF1433 domain-containing protein n=1 Tax=Staphylococcus edaphicus TaxID=1955013 RepID=A0A2C6WKX4_9STAP|nr:hypothetical protein [Staphylococcus edaphicus]PHK48735.1 hypothetical protein BTJ66_11910 [Staphylococcus edaphicus]